MAFAVVIFAAFAAAFGLGVVQAQQQTPATKVTALMKQVIAEYPKKYLLARIGFARPSRAKLDSGQIVVIRISPARDLPKGFQSAPDTPAPGLDEKAKPASARCQRRSPTCPRLECGLSCGPSVAKVTATASSQTNRRRRSTRAPYHSSLRGGTRNCLAAVIVYGHAGKREPSSWTSAHNTSMVAFAGNVGYCE